MEHDVDEIFKQVDAALATLSERLRGRQVLSEAPQVVDPYDGAAVRQAVRRATSEIDRILPASPTLDGFPNPGR